MIARAENIAAGLHAIGLRRGDRLALLSESRVEWTLTDAGCIFGGVIDVPIYPTLAPPQVRYILKDSGASALFIEGRQKFDELKEILAECPQIKQIVYFDSDGMSAAEGLSLAEIEKLGREFQQNNPGLLDQLAREITPDDLATIIYTSGTTGEPKGVMLTHSNLVTNVVSIVGGLPISSSDIALSVLPLSHIFERSGFYIFCYSGVSVYYTASFDQVGENLREVRPTVMTAVPRLFEKVYHRIVKKGYSQKGWKRRVFVNSLEVGQRYAELKDKGGRIWPKLALQHKLA